MKAFLPLRPPSEAPLRSRFRRFHPFAQPLGFPARSSACGPLRLAVLPAVLLVTLAAIPAAVAAPSPPSASHQLGPRPIGVVGEVALLLGNDGATGTEPWRSDGTSRGTFLLADLCPGRCSSSVRAVAGTPEGDLLFLEVAARRRELWRSDGTEAGTFALARLASGPTSGAWIAAGRRLVFEGWSRSAGAEPWVSDGTVAGTQPLADLVPGRGGSRPLFLDTFGDAAWFLASRPHVGRELWRTDGTPEGTQRVDGLPPVGPNRALSPLGRVGECLLYRRDWAGGTSVGSYCPAVGARVLLAELRPGRWQETVFQVADGGDRLLLAVLTPETTVQLWSTDGSPQGTHRLLEQPGSPPVGTLGKAVELAGGATVFRLHTPAAGSEPWVTDGTVAGTRLLADLCPGPCSSGGGRDLAAFGVRALLTAVGDPGGVDLWETDGTPAGTLPVADLVAAGEPAAPCPQLGDGGAQLFVVTGSAPAGALWRTDGTAAGTVQLATFGDLSEASEIAVLATLPGGSLLAVPRRVEAPADLWWTDGTAAGTRSVEVGGEGVEGGCVPDGEHLCLLEGRFRVRAEWRDFRTGRAGAAGAAAMPGSDRSGTFWFFDPSNVELAVKIVDGTAVDGYYWTLYGTLSDVESWIDVEDLETGWRRTYHQPAGRLCGRADTAFLEAHGPDEPWEVATVEAEAPSRSSPAAVEVSELPDCGDSEVLCLQADRFRLQVAWRDSRSGATGKGRALPASDRSGFFRFIGGHDPDLVVKVLDGRPVNDHWWLFRGPVTDLAYDLRVVDAVQGVERLYRSAGGHLCGGADTEAFDAQGAPTAAP